MLDQDAQEKLEPELRRVRRIALVVIPSGVIYWLLMYALVNINTDDRSFPLHAPGTEAYDVFARVRWVFLGVSLTAVPLGGILLRRKIISTLAQDWPEGKPVVPVYLRVTLICMAVLGAPAILGLVSFLLIGNLEFFAVFVIIGLIYQFPCFPTMAHLEAFMETVQGTKAGRYS